MTNNHCIKIHLKSSNPIPQIEFCAGSCTINHDGLEFILYTAEKLNIDEQRRGLNF